MFLVTFGLASAWAQQERYDRIQVVPAPKTVTIDGEFNEWDLSGRIDTALDEKLRPQFSVQLAAMYDADALYLGAHFVDDTPLVNRQDPKVSIGGGWNADCLQIRLCSDPTAPYPLPAHFAANTMCDLQMWYYTDRREPVLYISWGGTAQGTAKDQTFIGKESGLAFKADPDGPSTGSTSSTSSGQAKGWTVEARIPWARLNAPRPLKAGDRIAFVMQPEWGDAAGKKTASYFNDICTRGGFSYSDYSMWGQAVFLGQGRLSPQQKAKTGLEQQLPVTTTLKLPDAKATVVSATIYDGANTMVRTLLAGAEAQPMTTPVYGVRIAQRHGATLDVAWDGRDDRGKPLPAGDYTVKLLTSRGIGQKWVASVHNSGNPPWQTDDGTGSWGGDHAPAIGAAADAERIYLLWEYSECGVGLIACRPDGQKLWGAIAHGDGLTQGNYAVATDGEYVYVVQDGYPRGRVGTSKTFTPGVMRFEAATGKPASFPFGKRDLPVGDWEDRLMKPDFVYRDFVYNLDYNIWGYVAYQTGQPLARFKKLWEKLRTHDFGPQEVARNVLGLAATKSRLYVSRYLEDKVVAFDIATGKSVKEWSTASPAGLAAGPDGTIYAASGKRVVKLTEDGAVAPVVKEGLSSPWGITVDRNGRIYVSDCGETMQVKVFDATGKPAQTIGRPGGRPWIGKYDPSGLLEPAGLALDQDGKLWVCEFDLSPTRISVWQPGSASSPQADWSLAREYFGPTTYSVQATVDEEQPNLVCVHNTLFDVNYATGTVKPLCTMARDMYKGRQFRPSSYRYLFRHVKGRTYACSMDGAPVVHLVTKTPDGAWVAEPVAACGVLETIQFHGLSYDELPAKAREYWPNRLRVMYQWHDLNGDRLVQDDELTFTPAEQTKAKAPWYVESCWVDQDLTFWGRSVYTNEKAIVALKVKEWKNEVPIYEPCSEAEPLMESKGLYSVIPSDNAVYVDRGRVFDAVNPGELAKYRKDGQRVWAYARAYNTLQAPLPAPGDVICPWAWLSAVKTDNAGELLFSNGYFGQYFLLNGDGLFVGALGKDSRTGPKGGPDVVRMENFNGFFFRNKQNGRYYALGGDVDARIWEVTGIETLKQGTAPMTITAATAEQVKPSGSTSSTDSISSPRAETAKTAAPLILAKVKSGFQPAQASAWSAAKAVEWEAGLGRTARATLAYDEANLYARFEVTDRSPMVNGGKDWMTLFKSGDTCEIMLATDPQADPKRTQGAAGDTRVLFSCPQGQPVAVLYEVAVKPGEEKAPKTFLSPNQDAKFERLVQLANATVNVDRREDGYTLTATVPLKDLGFTPAAGRAVRGDVGVIFSDDGGTRAAMRSYYFNQQTGVTGDLPSEARLQPAEWGIITME